MKYIHFVLVPDQPHTYNVQAWMCIFQMFHTCFRLDALPQLLRSTAGRIVGGMNAEAAWDVLERSRLCRSITNDRTVLEVLNDQDITLPFKCTDGGRLHIALRIVSTFREATLPLSALILEATPSLIALLWYCTIC
jgi:hypothetical protein